MKLLFDQNLSHRLASRLLDVFPGSRQAVSLGLSRAHDFLIWEYARENGFLIVTLDRDFADLALLRGAPPKIIWLRCGNSTVQRIEALLRLHVDSILELETNENSVLLEIWP